MGKAGWLYDAKSHEKANEEGKNYWGVYAAELLDWLGVPAARVAPGDLEDAEKLSGITALVVGRDAATSLEGVAVDLEGWVRKGGLLIGFMREGGSGVVRVRSGCEAGMTLRIPRPVRGRSLEVSVDGKRRRPAAGTAVAEGFLMAPLEGGEHEVTMVEQ